MAAAFSSLLLRKSVLVKTINFVAEELEQTLPLTLRDLYFSHFVLSMNLSLRLSSSIIPHYLFSTLLQERTIVQRCPSRLTFHPAIPPRQYHRDQDWTIRWYLDQRVTRNQWMVTARRQQQHFLSHLFRLTLLRKALCRQRAVCHHRDSNVSQ